MSHDFQKISADLRIHFCPECKASFGCILDEDGDCDCEGAEHNWQKPWCPNCVERRENENCTCLGKRADGSGHHNRMCPCWEPADDIAEAFKKDLDQHLGRPLGVRIMG